MVTIHELLEDEVYKQFLCKVPILPAHLKRPSSKPWRVWVLTKNPKHWRYRDFHTYVEAFKFFKAARLKVLDASITCKSLGFNPPKHVVKVPGKYFTNAAGERLQVTKYQPWHYPMPADEPYHHWCSYCRRPTVFDYFLRHHALLPGRIGGVSVDSTVMRCSICGASERIVSLRD